MFNNDSGLILIISGPSGGGKSTVVHKLLDSSDKFAYSVSATTRKPRDGEVEGVDYYYLDRADFEKKLADGGFLEHNLYSGSTSLYGTPKKFVDDSMADGKIVVLEIDVNGARQVRAAYPGRTLLLFLIPPTLAELEERLRSRPDKAITEAEISRRLNTAKNEIAAVGEYDAVVYNRKNAIDGAVEDIHAALREFIEHRNGMIDAGKKFLG